MSHSLYSTPHADGYHMPAEWAPHTRTWMLWPERPDNWRQHAAPAQQAFVAVAAAISQFEPVAVGVSPHQVKTARSLLPAQVSVVTLPSNDAWMRDCGPTFVVNDSGGLRLVGWKFNAWGGLYTDWHLDEAVPLKVAEMIKIDHYTAPIILEGGSIHVDGEGTLLTTEECLLNKNRNHGLYREDLEFHLRAYTGAAKILWLGAGVHNDETSGHVDNLACFLRPGLVALTWTDDHNDPQYPISKDALDRLSAFTDARGRSLEVLKIHQPDTMLITPAEASGVTPVAGTHPRKPGDRMAASYINFYLCNGGVILPAFDDPHDLPAREALQQAFPDRKVVSVAAREILLGGGGIHCITQQQPKA